MFNFTMQIYRKDNCNTILSICFNIFLTLHIIYTIMAYIYNKWRLKEFAEKTGKTVSQMGGVVGISNMETVRGWLEGKNPRVDTVVKFASNAGINLLEFFEEDGIRMDEIYSKGEKVEVEEPTDTISYVEHLRQVSDMEKTHIKEMMQKDIDLAKKEVEMREQIRRELKAEFEADKRQIIESYEDRLRERDNDVAKLQQQVAELTVQYKELESSQGEKGYYPKGTITGVAESAYRK